MHRASFSYFSRLTLVAFVAIRSSFFRSLLTAIGVAVGAAAIMLIGSISEQVRSGVQSQLLLYDPSLIRVSIDKSSLPTLNVRPFGYQDITLIERSNVAEQVGYQSSSFVTASNDGIAQRVNAFGFSASMMDLRGIEVSTGVNLTEGDFSRGTNLVLITEDLADELFGEGNASRAIGDNILINGRVAVVSGIVKDENISSEIRILAIYMPFRSYERRFIDQRGDRRSADIDEIWLTFEQADSQGNESKVRDFFDRRADRGLTSANMDFSNLDGRVRAVEEALTSVTLGLSLIASISLFVAGTGVMNTMLATISERRREIGVRKAIGASSQDIYIQFLIESIVLTLLGAIAGVVLYSLLLFGIASSVEGWDPYPNPNFILLTILISLVIGIFFGAYPAMRASELSPVEAMRS